MSAARRVRLVELRAESDALVRRGALLLEDALRTASLPSVSPGRLLLFRSLDVGRIDSRAPPARLALTIEQRVRSLARTAVHAESPAAPRAAAVYFRDDAEPYSAIARRAARCEPLTAWFWPLATREVVVPRPPSSATRTEILRASLLGALASSAGPAAAIALITALHADGKLDALLGALEPRDGAALLAASGWTPRTLPPELVEPPSPRALDELPMLPLASHVTRWTATWSASDPRALWLAAIALVTGERANLASPRLVERAQRLLAALRAERAERTRAVDPAMPLAAPEDDATAVLSPIAREHEENDPPLDRTAREIDVATPRRELSPSDSTSPHEGATHATGSARVTEITSIEPSLAPARTIPAQSPGSPHRKADSRDALPDHASPTALGGLLFTIPILERIGIAALLERDERLADASLPARSFRRLAERLGAPPRDPMLLALRADRLDPASPEVLAAVRDLHTRSRRWCRRHARLGLHALVCRPARVLWTDTHVDVVFDHRQADIRVRRAGLDLDPGWIAWLGRVVRFHYVHGEELDDAP